MQSILQNSDALLRPDIGFVLPTIAAYSQNWLLVIVSAALQPFKWQSGCGCFVKLCARKRFSIRVAITLSMLMPITHYYLDLPTSQMEMVAAAIFSSLLLSRESFDTLLLKTVYMVSAFALPIHMALFLGVSVSALYAYLTGWTIRGREHIDVLAGNSVWLITRDGRLAKRVNNVGEFHLEYKVGSEIVIVGDGRLVGDRGQAIQSDLKRGGFVHTEGNLEAFEELVTSGKIVMKGDSVGFTQ